MPRIDDKTLAKIIGEECGIEFAGIQEGFGKVPAQALFNDPETRSTIAVRVPELTLERVREILEACRAAFRAAKEAIIESASQPLFPEGAENPLRIGKVK